MPDGSPHTVIAHFANPCPAPQDLGRLSVALIAGAVLAAVLGSQNMLTWVEDCPPSPITDSAIAAVGAWHDGIGRLGLDSLHRDLRHAERRQEGRADEM
jgi:hypothetical protein